MVKGMVGNNSGGSQKRLRELVPGFQSDAWMAKDKG